MELARRANSTGLAPFPLLERVDLLRRKASQALDSERQAEFGQFFTPPSVARLMASMFVAGEANVSVLDAGAGVGSLSAALVEELVLRERRPERITVTAVEVDPELVGYLGEALAICQEFCAEQGVEFQADLRCEDFIEAQAGALFSDLRDFNCAIANPPYRKIRAESKARRQLSSAGFETSNLYTGFLSLVVRALAPGGELVAITPRSFCNGPYFRTFRRYLLGTMSLRRLHVFDSREAAFRQEDVLQENIILHAAKSEVPPETVVISSSAGPEDEAPKQRAVTYGGVVASGDPDRVIHLVTDEVGEWVTQAMSAFACTLSDMGLSVSTGRVVEFRAKPYLHKEVAEGCVPLIYPSHFLNGSVCWPNDRGRKPNAIRRDPRTEELLVPNGYYVLLKRFSTKEEPRRIVAAVCDPTALPSGPLAFENHLNYIHRNGDGLDEGLAKGLALFLNSRLVDLYFRLFSGHTQVNAADVRRLVFPSEEELRSLGNRVHDQQPDQERIDKIIQEEFSRMAQANGGADPVQVQKRLHEAMSVLKALGLPTAQQNERSALTLLALLDLTPSKEWSAAASPLRGVTEMMTWFASHYGKTYAPNTRETVRKQTLHQFVQAGLVVANPDAPDRPTNSPHWVYRFEPNALAVVRQFGTRHWDRAVNRYLREVPELRLRYAQQREMARVPVRFGDVELALSPGEHNELARRVIDEMCSRFTPGARVVYVGDTQNKLAYLDEGTFAELGVTIEEHGKLPDVVVYDGSKNWLVLIEAVTSHGPVNPKRHEELKELFAGCTAGLVFVTAFPDRQTMVRYLSEISWETEVWLAEAPGHMIHFNGERFLGPHEVKD